MKQIHIFDHRVYFHTFQGKLHNGIPVYHAVRQRGGFGSIFRLLSKYAIPLLRRYIYPHARNSLISTASDLVSGTSNLKTSLKNNSKSFLKNVAGDIVKSAQTGGGKKKVKKTCVLL